MNKIDPAFIKVIADNVTEVKETAGNIPDWKYAADKFDQFFNLMANSSDSLWSAEMMKELRETYFKARDNDKSYTNLPIAKSDVREKMLKNIFHEDFIWIKKSQKREDIPANSEKLKSCLDQLSSEVNLQINYEAWSRLLNLKYIKAFIN